MFICLEVFEKKHLKTVKLNYNKLGLVKTNIFFPFFSVQNPCLLHKPPRLYQNSGYNDTFGQSKAVCYSRV